MPRGFDRLKYLSGPTPCSREMGYVNSASGEGAAYVRLPPMRGALDIPITPMGIYNGDGWRDKFGAYALYLMVELGL